jgi:hypothetical protein
LFWSASFDRNVHEVAEELLEKGRVGHGSHDAFGNARCDLSTGLVEIAIVRLAPDDEVPHPFLFDG